MRVLINGSKGRMGKALIAEAPSAGATVVCTKDIGDPLHTGLEDCEVAIDFSFHSATIPLAEALAERHIPLVIGTTGHSQAELQRIDALAQQIPIAIAGNFSVGVNVLLFLTETAARCLGKDYDPEITEVHHRHKKDAPSGTALNLADAIRTAPDFANCPLLNGREGVADERPNPLLGLHALRGGEVIGEHTVFFFGSHDRIELTHRAADRSIFAAGAFRAAAWLRHQPPGRYSMRDVLGLSS